MMTSRTAAAYPLVLSEPEGQWAYTRLWRLLIPVFMGLTQRFSGQFGATLALSVMVLTHVIASAEWEGCLPGSWLLAVNLAVRERFGSPLPVGKSGEGGRFER